MFTNNWFDDYHVAVFLQAKTLGHTPRCLEIGSYEGRSSVWISENMAGSHGSLTCVDTWDGSAEHSDKDKCNLYERFLANTTSQRSAGQIRPLRGKSIDVLSKLVSEHTQYDLVYIDGSHIMKDVLADALLAYHMLAENGILIFDDYTWGDGIAPYQRPQAAIDAFLLSITGTFTLLCSKHTETQRGLVVYSCSVSSLNDLFC